MSSSHSHQVGMKAGPMPAFRRSVLAATAALVAVGCHASSPSTYQAVPQASLTMEIAVDFGRREAFVTTLKSTVIKALASGVSASVDVNDEGYPSNASQTISAGVDLYTSALDDAQHKAKAIAQRLHVSLGPVLSVAEQLQSYPIPGVQSLKGNVSQSFVRISPNEPVVLYVVFTVSAPGAASSSIAVYGLSSSDTEVTASARAPKTTNVHVQIMGHGKDMQAATDAQSRIESAVRQASSAFGIPDSSIHLIGSNFSQP
jgi:uncharacterized protein YggE